MAAGAVVAVLVACFGPGAVAYPTRPQPSPSQSTDMQISGADATNLNSDLVRLAGSLKQLCDTAKEITTDYPDYSQSDHFEGDFKLIGGSTIGPIELRNDGKSQTLTFGNACDGLSQAGPGLQVDKSMKLLKDSADQLKKFIQSIDFDIRNLVRDLNADPVLLQATSQNGTASRLSANIAGVWSSFDPVNEQLEKITGTKVNIERAPQINVIKGTEGKTDNLPPAPPAAKSITVPPLLAPAIGLVLLGLLVTILVEVSRKDAVNASKEAASAISSTQREVETLTTKVIELGKQVSDLIQKLDRMPNSQSIVEQALEAVRLVQMSRKEEVHEWQNDPSSSSQFASGTSTMEGRGSLSDAIAQAAAAPANIAPPAYKPGTDVIKDYDMARTIESKTQREPWLRKFYDRVFTLTCLNSQVASSQPSDVRFAEDQGGYFLAVDDGNGIKVFPNLAADLQKDSQYLNGVFNYPDQRGNSLYVFRPATIRQYAGERLALVEPGEIKNG